MAERQRFGCLDTWPCSIKQSLSLRFPIESGIFSRHLLFQTYQLIGINLRAYSHFPPFWNAKKLQIPRKETLEPKRYPQGTQGTPKVLPRSGTPKAHPRYTRGTMRYTQGTPKVPLGQGALSLPRVTRNCLEVPRIISLNFI